MTVMTFMNAVESVWESIRDAIQHIGPLPATYRTNTTATTVAQNAAPGLLVGLVKGLVDIEERPTGKRVSSATRPARTRLNHPAFTPPGTYLDVSGGILSPGSR